MTAQPPDGRRLKLDPAASSARPDLPAFLSPPKGAPAYHGFPLIEETLTDGWMYGAITEVPDPEDGTAGDAYVVAPDGARAGIAWSVGTYPTAPICRPDPARWGVFAIAFPRPVRSMDDLLVCFRQILPDLKHRYAEHLGVRRRFGPLSALFRARSRREYFVVLTVRVPDGATAETAFAIREALNRQGPDGWWLVTHDTFLAYFLLRLSGAVRARDCRTAIESLRRGNESLASITLSMAEGILVARFNRHGRPTTLPFGVTTESDLADL